MWKFSFISSFSLSHELFDLLAEVVLEGDEELLKSCRETCLMLSKKEGTSLFLCCSVCHLQLPEPVLRVSGRRERHHVRDPGEAHTVSERLHMHVKNQQLYDIFL